MTAALKQGIHPEMLSSCVGTAHGNVSRVSECESKSFSGNHSYVERSVATDSCFAFGETGK